MYDKEVELATSKFEFEKAEKTFKILDEVTDKVKNDFFDPTKPEFNCMEVRRLFSGTFDDYKMAKIRLEIAREDYELLKNNKGENNE